MNPERKLLDIRGTGVLEIVTINGELAEIILHIPNAVPDEKGTVLVFLTADDAKRLYIALTPYLGKMP